MKILQGILFVIAVAVCYPAPAETPVAAYGVTVVGQPPCFVGAPGLRCSTLTGKPYVLIGAYATPGDNGGGYFALGPSGCTDNGGTVLKDQVGNCFYRVNAGAALSVKWFGAKCDAITTVTGGVVAQGSTAFSTTSPTFQTTDQGKVIELFYNSASPFRTTIASVTDSEHVVLNHASPNVFPGNSGAHNADFSSYLRKGLDVPGSGYEPGDVLTVQGGTASTPAEVTVTATGLVAFTPTVAGTGYNVGDLISFYAGGTGFDTKRPAVIQVTSVSSGAVTAYTWISNGSYVPTTGSGNPTILVGTSTGTGTNYTVSLLPSDGSFGVAEVNSTPTQAGQYTALPPIPSTLSTMRGGTAATVDLHFKTPSWTYGTDDTVAFQSMEGVLEADTNRGVFGAGEVPGGSTCLLQTLQINRPVTWRSSGGSQAQLMQLLGAQGSTVDNIHYGFILASASYPPFDQYQDDSVGQQWVSFENIEIAGGTTQQSVQVDGTTLSCTLSGPTYCNDGLHFQAPAKAAGQVAAAGIMRNLQVVNFPGNALSAYHMGGEMRAYNVFAASAGGNCWDIENTANPYRFYGISGGTCSIPLNLVNARGMEFHGASFWGGTGPATISVTGTVSDPDGYILFDGLQDGPSQQADMYLDQQNETVVCTGNCLFGDADTGGGATTPAAILVGPDATTIATGVSPIVLQLDKGIIEAPSVRHNNGKDIYFSTGSGTTECHCAVALGGGMVDVVTKQTSSQPGAPTTNDSTKLAGQTTYAPPTFANAGTVGTPPPSSSPVPLNLTPNELGIIATTSGTAAAPNGTGLKLRVECSGTTAHDVRLVALAGTSNTETILADGIGGGAVSACP
jgi:hypothetical protein